MLPTESFCFLARSWETRTVLPVSVASEPAVNSNGTAFPKDAGSMAAAKPRSPLSETGR